MIATSRSRRKAAVPRTRRHPGRPGARGTASAPPPSRPLPPNGPRPVGPALHADDRATEAADRAFFDAYRAFLGREGRSEIWTAEEEEQASLRHLGQGNL